MNVRFSRSAEMHLAEIFEYGEINYGLSQAEEYAAEFRDAFDLLKTQPKLGMKLEKRGFTHLRKIRWNSHVIVYGVDKVNLNIMGVVHKRADLYRHVVTRMFQ